MEGDGWSWGRRGEVARYSISKLSKSDACNRELLEKEDKFSIFSLMKLRKEL